MIGRGPFGLKPGQWTDDTSMALCLAASLIETGGFDPLDQMQRYVRWFREGYMSSTGECFDIGNTTHDALSHFERFGDPFAGSTNPNAAGNGSLMRLAPVPMRYAAEPQEAIDRSAESSRTTHGAREAVDACRYFASLLIGALNGLDKETLRPRWVEGLWEPSPLARKVDEIATGFQVQGAPGIAERATSWTRWRPWAWTHNFREGAEGGQPRRRRYHRRDLRADCRRVLGPGVAGAAHDEG